MKHLHTLLLLIGLLFVVACGKSKPTEEEFVDITGRDMVTELGVLLKSQATEKKPMPKSANDLVALEPIFPLAAGKVSGGELVYAWGTALSEGSGDLTIIAHPHDAETNGGWVLYKDGSVKKLKVDEFASATKATKPAKKK